ncbi:MULTISPECIES: cytochrome c [unclassified Polynucleobacter]|uniref:c-type cytochrome n=1 Tax=unclassified Polynucleobacter TaxID=2640945 RepID=UPI001BFCE509|nr:MULTISPECIES: cytochrome c [unclassified Polynucleobacter]MBU3603148.1 cytochrome c [Polynucleobacter sp. AP-Kaivos-20-H2]MBU3618826.1 cytochrome c [Polynucleobacter sp. JS-Fieb-80-E5]QWD82505.1 cytochrome c [Polynucleobacter sp. MWH-S4W17]
MKFALITAVLLSSIGLVNVANAANVDKGQALVEKANCASCHGAGLNAPILPVYPKLAGQYSDYLYYALKAYKVGNGNPQYGRNNAIMGSQVQAFSDADMQDIAAYVSSLPGNFVIKK